MAILAPVVSCALDAAGLAFGSAALRFNAGAYSGYTEPQKQHGGKCHACAEPGSKETWTLPLGGRYSPTDRREAMDPLPREPAQG